MADDTIMYPKECRKSLKVIKEKAGIDVETAYAMMLMTALLMDLHPEDEEVLAMVLQDCGVNDVDLCEP